MCKTACIMPSLLCDINFKAGAQKATAAQLESGCSALVTKSSCTPGCQLTPSASCSLALFCKKVQQCKTTTPLVDKGCITNMHWSLVS